MNVTFLSNEISYFSLDSDKLLLVVIIQ